MDNNFSTIKERILYFAKYKKISYEFFFEDIGMTYGNFKGNAKKTPLNSDAVAIILTKYPELNPIWLLTGEGGMLKSDIPIINNSELEKEIKELKDRYISVLEENRELRQKLEAKDKSAGNPKLVGKHAATE